MLLLKKIDIVLSEKPKKKRGKQHISWQIISRPAEGNLGHGDLGTWRTLDGDLRTWGLGTLGLGTWELGNLGVLASNFL